MIGPLVGGLFAGADQILGITGWRWVFLINVPVGLVALGMVFVFLHLPSFGHASTRFDWWGATLIVATLAPLLLVAEQGREWGWTSAPSVACYAVGLVGLVALILVERALGADAIIPLRLFRSQAITTATVLSVLVGFGMFGAMMTILLYLQIVNGMSPTESGFATLPMMAGLMLASIGSGQLIARTGKFGVFPVTGTLTVAVGFGILTQITVDRPAWFLMIAMFVVGAGLGQLMQTLTLAVQSSASARDIGVATSAATFFRQIGGTLGTAVLLSMLFSILPLNVAHTLTDKPTLTAALNAALDPSVAKVPQNAGVMDAMWTPVTDTIKTKVNENLATATDQVNTQVEAVVRAKVTAAVVAGSSTGAGKLADGATKLAGVQKLIDDKVAEALPKARAEALAKVADEKHLSVVNGRLARDWSNATQREAMVDQMVPTMIEAINSGDSEQLSTNADASDTSFLKGADAALTRPFLTGFNESVVSIYWVGLAVMGLAFVIACFFRVPALRERSALEEKSAAMESLG